MARSSSNGDSDETIRSRSKRAREDEGDFNFDALIGAEEEEEEEEPNNEPQVHEQQEGSHVVVTLTDPELFDCPICYEPLTIPVYQCDQNSHIACSSCRTKINNNVPPVLGSTGSIVAQQSRRLSNQSQHPAKTCSMDAKNL
ncbi:hypothetical protein Prudu_682S000700 [Prunus dulcis]|uniref:E3 ubiquitin-protein ligase Sina-like RING finger domain-containing protein n=1 Tax=Prunus dulcis TaxID=3755 RepID=A0A5H2XS79_PRUDU|nr:hypothetical protein Prudu_682S000700 [Prunus dulcis]